MGLQNVLQSYLGSYASRDKDTEFLDWLAQRLNQDLPEVDCKNLAADILEAVERYDRALENLGEAIDAGQSKEDWLAERMEEACIDMPIDEAGNGLEQIERDLYSSNALLMDDTEPVPDGKVFDVVAEVGDWNEYGIKQKVIDIGQQAVMAGIGAAANAAQQNLEDGDSASIGEAIENALLSGVDAGASEVKAVVAGAMKSASVNGLVDILPPETPTEAICDIACASVECVDALACAASGKITVVEAIERIAKASVTAVCKMGCVALKVSLLKIPAVGPLISTCASSLLKQMNIPKISENIYNVVREAAIGTWNGIKRTASNLMNKLKGFVSQKLFN